GLAALVLDRAGLRLRLSPLLLAPLLFGEAVLLGALKLGGAPRLSRTGLGDRLLAHRHAGRRVGPEGGRRDGGPLAVLRREGEARPGLARRPGGGRRG